MIDVTFQIAADDRVRLISVERNGNGEFNRVEIDTSAFRDRESAKDNLRKQSSAESLGAR